MKLRLPWCLSLDRRVFPKIRRESEPNPSSATERRHLRDDDEVNSSPNTFNNSHDDAQQSAGVVDAEMLRRMLSDLLDGHLL